jgi:uncharacterized membrane protein SpoIIM required for sporulation
VDLDAYVAERRGEWGRLRALTRTRRLTPAEADELVLLYQRAATHLSVIRGRAPDPALVASLSRLVIAARAKLTGGRRFSLRPVGHFFAAGLPGELYRARWWWGTVAVVSVIASVILVAYVSAHPALPRRFMSDAEIRQLVDNDFVGYYSAFHAQNFAAEVWTNNAWLTAQCLAAGVLIAPVFYLLGMNVLNIGLVGGVMAGAGRTDVLLTYLAPHGLLALGLAVALGVSGLLEAYVTPSALPAAIRIAIGAVVWLAFLAYALVLGRIADQHGDTADLEGDLLDAPVPTA